MTWFNGSSTQQITEIEIWQPWLKRRCNFATRVIIPNRLNILKILESKNRFMHQVRYINVSMVSPAVSF
jgi:hypothetical protein